jgi:hypothetical protein
MGMADSPTLGERCGLIESKAGSEESSLKEKECQVANGLVSLSLGHLPLELLDNGV